MRGGGRRECAAYGACIDGSIQSHERKTWTGISGGINVHILYILRIYKIYIIYTINI